MSLIERARVLRHTIEGLAVSLPDDSALDNVELFPQWSGDGVGYLVGDRVRYDGILYKVLQDHTSQEGWTPADAPSLFARVLIPDPQKIPVWQQPDSTNGYSAQDKVYYPNEGDTIYISLVDNNVWVPEGNPTLWAVYEEEASDDEPTPDPEPEPEPEPTEEIPEWVTPDATHFYMKGDKVRYNGKIYESVIDNNVWSPDAGETIWKEVTE